MRHFFYLFLGLFLIIPFSSCKEDDPPSPEDQALRDRRALLESTVWEAVRVTNNEEPVYSYYNFTLEVSGDLMTTNDRYRVFPTTRYTFVDNNPDLVLRQVDDITMTLSNVSDTTLTISFTLDQSFDDFNDGGTPGGREEQLSGDYIFIMTPRE
ncbi:hypothetical protein AB9P05_14435 [Roseivirga sp. BDSF3-8]|uniref:hypothetical protein n=1 Tax=Roseivirga sp. BDSF3-8 TaxID=3241598 RepID=UPI0035327331